MFIFSNVKIVQRKKNNFIYCSFICRKSLYFKSTQFLFHFDVWMCILLCEYDHLNYYLCSINIRGGVKWFCVINAGTGNKSEKRERRTKKTSLNCSSAQKSKSNQMFGDSWWFLIIFLLMPKRLHGDLWNSWDWTS